MGWHLLRSQARTGLLMVIETGFKAWFCWKRPRMAGLLIMTTWPSMKGTNDRRGWSLPTLKVVQSLETRGDVAASQKTRCKYSRISYVLMQYIPRDSMSRLTYKFC